MSDTRIHSLVSYPVKSMCGNNLTSASIDARGITGDRRWMVIRPDGRFITGRQLPALTQISVVSDAGGIQLHDGLDEIMVAVPSESARDVKATVWADQLTVSDAGDAVANWLSARLDMSVRLVYQHDHQKRLLPVDKRMIGEDEVSFADGYPLLLIGTASLADLNARLQTPVTMAHFRPNIVVETDTPYEEDLWHSVTTAEGFSLRIASPCSRCIFTTVDPATGTRHPDREPLTTLRQYRQESATQKIMFGVNVIPDGTGVLGLQQRLQVSVS